MLTIVVIDDDVDMEQLLQGWFSDQIEQQLYTFLFAHDGNEGLALIREEPAVDLVLLDVSLPQHNGLDVLLEISRHYPLVATVMVSATDDVHTLRTAMNRGAFDFVSKPIDFNDLALTIEKAAQHVRLLRESQQLQVINEFKTRFFDNITHEFRTPLTLILSPVEKLLQRPVEPDVLRADLLMVERNAQQLLRLINQLLDLAKLEAGHLTLSPKAGDLTSFVGQIVEIFRPLAAERQIDLVYTSDLTGFYAFDSEKIEQIVHNLLMNALKFTAAGQITVRVEPGNTVRLLVADTGIGIVPEKLPNLFNRFYQVMPPLSRTSQLREQEKGRLSDFMHSGTGIGLALIKELTELMHGRVSVASKVANEADKTSGTVFTVELPLRSVPTTPILDAKPVMEPIYWMSQSNASPHTTPAKPAPISPDDMSEKALILVVEDNTELGNFIAKELSMNYRVLTADNGEEGLRLARTELPDIVLTDVMMPGIDGYELTHRLKNDLITDHIAVVMLTAKTAQPSRIEGLQQGADDYISKPFHLDELRLRLGNLIARQQTLRAHYQQLLTQPAASLPTETLSDKFLQKLQAGLEAHLDDSQFGVEELAHEVGMSRRTLYRKLTATTNLTIHDFMRQYRLRRATEFLAAGRNVSETAYLVGYESPAHFSTVFKDVYQHPPSAFMKK